MAKYRVQINNQSRISISYGNSKIGMMLNWSTLPGDDDHMITKDGEPLIDVPGTCTGKCSGCYKNCYAMKSARLHHNACIPSWAKNTLMMRKYPGLTFKQIDEEIYQANRKYYQTGNAADIKYKFFRINVSGELESVDEFERWNRLAAKHPEIKFGIYSKNTKVILGFFKKFDQTAENLTVNISQWHGVMDDTIEKLKQLGAIVNVFEYDDTNRSWCVLSDLEKTRLAGCIKCPAVTKNGHHAIKPDGSPILCTDCGRCYRKTGEVTTVYDH